MENKNREKSRRRDSIYSPGIPLLCTILLIVCLVLITAVSATASSKELKDSKAYAARRTAYIEAQNKAAERCRQVNEGLSKETSFEISLDTGGSMQFRLSQDENGKYSVAAWKIKGNDKWKGSETVGGITWES